MAQQHGEPGTYVVTASGKETTIAGASGYRYATDPAREGNLEVTGENGTVLGEFRWWDSIIRTGD